MNIIFEEVGSYEVASITIAFIMIPHICLILTSMNISAPLKYSYSVSFKELIYTSCI